MYQPYQSTWNNPYLPLYNQGMPVQQSNYTPVNGIIKVNGPQSAMQFQLPPNSTSPALFDASGTCFYVISTDGTGTKSIECFDFSPHVDDVQAHNTPDYVSRQEFNDLATKVSQLMGAGNGTHESIPRPTE